MTIQDKIKSIIEEHFIPNENGGIEIYTDYIDRELSNSFLFDLMTSNNPREVFRESLYEWTYDYANYYGEDDLLGVIKNNLTDEEFEEYSEIEEELKEWIFNNYYFYYNENDFNCNVKVNLMLDTGDMNYDFTKNNILNYYSSWYDSKGKFETESSILWLAKQMKKATKLRESCKKQYKQDGNYVEREKEPDRFIESIIQELENLTCHMSSLTFLLNMSLFEYFELREEMLRESELNKSYYYKERAGKGYIKISKDTMCGLFNPWQGGGSVLEIELPDDLKIPFKAIFAAEIETGKSNYGYSVNSVYGLVGSAWNGTIKEIHSMKEEIK